MKRIALLLALCGCPQPPSPPQPDSGDAALLGDAPSTPAAVCSNLAAIGCLEGADPKCADVISHAIDAGLTKINASCLARAKTKTDARGCGEFVACP